MTHLQQQGAYATFFSCLPSVPENDAGEIETNYKQLTSGSNSGSNKYIINNLCPYNPRDHNTSITKSL